jgi:uncharacterized protein YqeY
MTLKEQLFEDYKQALKNRDEIAKNTIGLARAAVKQREIDDRVELDDAGVQQVLQKQIKMRTDALADFEKAGRTDLSDGYKAEIEVLKKYIPEQMSAEEIAAVVKETAAGLGIENGRQNMGKLMGAVMGRLKGKADGNDVRKAVTEFLS